MTTFLFEIRMRDKTIKRFMFCLHRRKLAGKIQVETGQQSCTSQAKQHQKAYAASEQGSYKMKSPGFHQIACLSKLFV